MSKTAEIILLWERAKWGALIGLGYLAAKRPRTAASIAWRIGKRMIVNNVKDTAFALKVVYQELIHPEVMQPAARVARVQWANLLARGPIYGTTLLLTTGGAAAQVFAQGAEVVLPNNPLIPGKGDPWDAR